MIVLRKAEGNLLLFPVSGRTEPVSFVKSLIKEGNVRVAAFAGELLDRLFRIGKKPGGALKADICKAGMGGDAELRFHALVDIFRGVMKTGGQRLCGDML